MRNTGVLIALLLIASASFGQDTPPEFEVEIIVFRHLEPDTTEQAVDRPTDTEGAMVRRKRFPALPADQLRLGGAVQRMMSSSNFSPILHAGWLQPTETRETAAAMGVSGNRRGSSVNGTVRVSLDRFLRIEVDLELDTGSGEIFYIDQARRVRSGEIHYFDHPQFGVIAIVNRPQA